MKILEKIDRMGIIPDKMLLQLYPPFLFMGVKILHLRDDYRSMTVKLPLRWYGSNMHGTLFGGWLSAVSDPLAALLCAKIFPDVVVWTKSHHIEFKRPAASDVTMQVEITDTDIEAIRKSLDTTGRAHHCFEFDIKDSKDKVVARVKNTPFLGLKGQIKGRKPDD